LCQVHGNFQATTFLVVLPLRIPKQDKAVSYDTFLIASSSLVNTWLGRKAQIWLRRLAILFAFQQDKHCVGSIRVGALEPKLVQDLDKVLQFISIGRRFKSRSYFRNLEYTGISQDSMSFS
jgi:hypothetical protein